MKGRCKLSVFVVGPGKQVHKSHRKDRVSKARVIIITGSFFHVEMWSECTVFSSLIRGYCDLSSGVSLWHFIGSYRGLSSGFFSVAFHQELLMSVIRGFSVAFHQELLRHFIRGYCVVLYRGISMCFFIMGYRGLSSGVTVVFHPGLLFSLSSGVTIQSFIRGYCGFSSGVTLPSVIRDYSSVCYQELYCFSSGVTVVFHQGLLFSLSSGVTVVIHQGFNCTLQWPCMQIAQSYPCFQPVLEYTPYTVSFLTPGHPPVIALLRQTSCLSIIYVLFVRLNSGKRAVQGKCRILLGPYINHFTDK